MQYITNINTNYNKWAVTLWDIQVFVVILIFFKPAIAEDIPIVDLLFNAGRFGLAIVYIGEMFIWRRKINKDWMLLAVIFIIVLMSTLIRGGAYAKALAHYFPSVGMVAFLTLNKKKIKQILVIIVNMGISLLVINLISVLMFPDGILYRASDSFKIWILCQKQDLGGFIFPFLYAALSLRYYDKKYDRKYQLILILSCISAILEQPLGVIICIVVFLFLIFFDKFLMKIDRWSLLITLISAFVITQFICFYFDKMIWVQDLLAYIKLEGVSKVRTVNVRFSMWKFAWETLAQYPFLGVGKLTRDNWMKMTNVGYHSILDNMYMDVLFTGGIVAFGIFLNILVRNFIALRIVWNEKRGRQVGYCLFALCILFLEGCPYFPSVFFVLSTPIWIDFLRKKNIYKVE